MLPFNLEHVLKTNHHIELDQLHKTGLQVYELRTKTLPSQSFSIFETPLISATGAALMLSEQAYSMIVFGCYIGARVVWDWWQQKNMLADEKCIKQLYCHSELFAQRFPQYAHVDEAVRFLIHMGLSQKSVEQLIGALNTFESSSVPVEAPNPPYKIASPKHLRL